MPRANRSDPTRDPAPQVDVDLLVFGESAAGVAAAVRGARSGLRTMLVTVDEHLAGVLASLGAIETHYDGVRAPLLEEFRRRVVDHYRDTYGSASPQLQRCVGEGDRYPMTTFEPHVALQVVRSIVAAEPCLELLHRQRPIAVERDRRRMLAVRFAPLDGGVPTVVRARSFVDASYVGDLAATAGVAYRVGRESRHEYGELHAGKLFTRWVDGSFPIDAAVGRLNLHAKRTTMGILAGSTGEGDDEVQDYSYRLCLSDDPERRRLPQRPAGYRREDYLAIALPPEEIGTRPYALHHRVLTRSLRDMIAEDHLIHGHALPNGKRSWNATNFTGAGKAYAEADPVARRDIERRHLDHALGILYFLQNDEAVPPDVREAARAWGLATDEYADNGNVPYHLYVREARRIVGRATFTEHDALLAPGSARTPCHADSIAITDFPLDSLACTTERRPGTTCDGQFFLQEQTRPAQVPFGVMLPQDLDNLVVPVCVSSTHVAWGTLRQTPTLMQLGEVAGRAAALARERGVDVAAIDVIDLQRQLVEDGHMISFFNDFDMATQAPWVAAVQGIATHGFFDGYDALPRAYLGHLGAERWRTRAEALGLGPATIAALQPDAVVGDAAIEVWGALLRAASSRRPAPARSGVRSGGPEASSR